ncbi:DNA/RNA non-specific endonuclease [Romboutsia ilealis]|uniref:DNA/RNA non-specific endonuclease n=1 Tax=Romboutsia ilealis TaxID=1115758 RepID=UPI00272D966F|nr:DNA/RNA non-specific endonuclease [Romboutsia ilealis]
MFFKNIRKSIGIIPILAILITGCSNNNIESNQVDNLNNSPTTIVKGSSIDKNENTETSHTTTTQSNSDNKEDMFDGYKIIEVDGGNLSGYREPNVAVDIGFGDREYWAFTNESGQLVKVVAKEIILQDDSKEPVNSKGRYYPDEAKVPGVESKNLDEGHVIADSLGGVSNAYNITPQNSTLNRHGDQAYMEKAIREVGGCTDFVAIITYPNTTTQIPSHYSYTYTIKGNVVNDEFDNINPDEYNASLNSNTSTNNSSNSSSKDKNTTSNSTTNNSQSSTNSSAIVYWTPNGKSYHTTKSCSTLSRSKIINSGTQEQSGKSDPCDRCHEYNESRSIQTPTFFCVQGAYIRSCRL